MPVRVVLKQRRRGFIESDWELKLELEVKVKAEMEVGRLVRRGPHAGHETK